MVERLHADMARRTVAIAQAIQRSSWSRWRSPMPLWWRGDPD